MSLMDVKVVEVIALRGHALSILALISATASLAVRVAPMMVAEANPVQSP